MGKGSKGMALLVLMSPVDAQAGRILAVFMLVFNIFQPRSCRAASARGHEKLERSCLRIPCGFLTQLLISIQSGASRVDGRLTDVKTLGICPPFCFFSPALHAPRAFRFPNHFIISINRYPVWFLGGQEAPETPMKAHLEGKGRRNRFSGDKVCRNQRSNVGIRPTRCTSVCLKYILYVGTKDASASLRMTS